MIYIQENAEKIRELYKKACELPLLPGVYIMKNSEGEIIYIGKAKRLKNRVSQYFRNIHSHLPKVYQMVIRVDRFEHILCDSEFEALVLECNLIKQHTPKYNILLKDDKGYHYIKLSPPPFQKISTAKQSETVCAKDGSVFIGPYMSAFAVKNIAEDANKIFKLPTCSRIFPRDIGKKRPCLQYYLGQCVAPCTGKISQSEYAEIFKDANDYINGNGKVDTEALRKQMQAASDNLDFELAARLRDRIRAVEKLCDNQKIFIENKVDCDYIALAAGQRKCCIGILCYRKGRLCDSVQHIFDIPSEYSELLSQFIAQYYREKDKIPREICVNIFLSDKAALERFLGEIRGTKVDISQPKKGERYKLIMMSQSNAFEGLTAYTDIDSREIAALSELSRLLSLEKIPEFIESYDISNLGDKYMVGGMVVFENGRPLKKEYKKFTIKDQLIQDDYSAMQQVLRRRFNEYLSAEDKSSGFGRLPDLILLDGGKGHVGAIRTVLNEFNLDIPLFGMVKDGKHRTRAIASDDEISIASSRSAFTLVSRIQDEVHRYTIGFERQKHKNSAVTLALTQIDGIGKAKANELIKHFKSLNSVRNADRDELCRVKGISPAIADKIIEYFKNN